MELGEFLKHAREAAGLTQVELAEKVGLTQMSISKMERGDGYPSFPSAKRLADALDISLDDMLDKVPTNL